MAEVVAAVGVPHTPAFPSMVDSGRGPGVVVGQVYEQVRATLRAADVDVVVMFDSDHLNSFFLDNLPALSVPTAARASGSNDGTAGIKDRDVELLPELASRVLNDLTAKGYFPARTAALTLDHSVMVPLQFLDPDRQMKLLPIYLNGLVAPFPTAARCRELGADVLAAINTWDSQARVGLVASGSFSLEVGGPRIDDNSLAGVPDPEWAAHVTRRLKAGQVDELVAEATSERMRRAGNVAAELLNWIALLGAVGRRPPDLLELQESFGHSFAAWTLD